MNSFNGSQTITLSEMSEEAKERLLDEIRPKSEWIYTGDDDLAINDFACLKCGYATDSDVFKFCPECGAKIVKGYLESIREQMTRT